MSVGKSGRVVIEVDPELKKDLYATLAKQQCTLKDWFIENAQKFLENHEQPNLFEEKGK